MCKDATRQAGQENYVKLRNGPVPFPLPPTTPQPNQIQPSPAQPEPLSFWKSDDERRLLRAGDSKWEWLIYALHSSFNRQPAKEKRDSENFSKLFLRPNDSEM